MQLPDFLRQAIEAKTSKFKPQQLAQFSQKLSERYRQNKKDCNAFMRGEGDYLAYLTTRVPATYAAIVHVLKAIRERMDWDVETFLDVGAGPGTGLWAVNTVFENVNRATLIEKNRGLISLGKSFNAATWLERDLEEKIDFGEHELVLASYVLGELSESGWQNLIEPLWMSTSKVIIFIEPGTPAGFKRIHHVREKLLSLGAHLIAPCPHQKKCPMQGGDWCHFAQRVERSSLHRRVKEADLNYEDEKFSYIAASKEEILLEGSRILRHPVKRSGHVELTLCGSDGVKTEVVSRKSKENYRDARKAAWGSLFKLNTSPVD